MANSTWGFDKREQRQARITSCSPPLPAPANGALADSPVARWIWIGTAPNLVFCTLAAMTDPCRTALQISACSERLDLPSLA
jgi:hypothetical protein